MCAMPNVMGTRSLTDTRSLGTVTIVAMLLVPHLGEATGVLAGYGGCCGSCTSSSWGVTRHTLKQRLQMEPAGMYARILHLLETSVTPVRQNLSF